MIPTIAEKTNLKIVGLMSGTSADGIDAALINLCEETDGLSWHLLGYKTIKYTDDLREQILRVSDIKTSRIDQLCRLNFILGEIFAAAAFSVVETAGLLMTDIDLIGSHGQTVHHLPSREEQFGVTTGATLQVGETSVIAQRTGVVTVGDFRPADVARRGQGAPLVPLVDYLLFQHPVRSRALLNLGGIANLTVIPPSSKLEDVIAFDTGPANMLIDAVAASETNNNIDWSGGGARKGIPSEKLVTKVLEMPYFKKHPPKSTGGELFGRSCAEDLLNEGGKISLSANDLLATTTEITIRSISNAYLHFVKPITKLDEVLVSGGGAQNSFILERLSQVLSPIKVIKSDNHGLPSDAKEAVAFAILANQTIRGRQGNLPSATGADKSAVLGKICLPG